MGLLNGSIGMRRYAIADGDPEEIGYKTQEIQAHAFRGFAEEDEREMVAGWLPLTDEGDFADRNGWLVDGRFGFLRLRTDTRTVPAYLLREVSREMEREWKSRAGREDLTRAERNEIQVIAYGRLLARALPRTRLTDVMVDLESDAVAFLNTGDAANDVFRALFEKTFGVKLRHLSPGAAALACFPWEAHGARWNKLFGGGEPAAVLRYLPERGWAPDFLTWLWFRTESENGELEPQVAGKVVLWVEDRLRLVGMDGESHDVTLKTGDVGKSAEAASALGGKKQTAEARFGMIREDREYRFLVKAETFDLCGLKAPKASVEGDDADAWKAAALVRANGLAEVAQVLDCLYAEYLELRLSGAWERATHPEMQRWAEAKAQVQG
jgi:hypothetical protein